LSCPHRKKGGGEKKKKKGERGTGCGDEVVLGEDNSRGGKRAGCLKIVKKDTGMMTVIWP